MRRSFLAGPALAITGLALSGTALAQLSPAEEDIDRRLCSIERLENCLNGVGGGVTSLDSLRINAGVPRVRKDDEERAEALARGATGGGMAAGEGILGGFGVWVGGGYSDYESDVRIAPYEATTWNLLAGIDRVFGDRFLLGVSVGYEDTETDTFYNDGGQDRTGFTVSPYAAFLINDIFSIDASVGYSWIETDENRLATNNGARLLGSYDSDRYFISTNLNAFYPVERWVFGGRVGLLHTKESQDAYTETGASTQVRSVRERNVDLTQFQIGGDVGYSFGPLEPYATLVYRHDLSSDDGNSAGGLPGGVVTQPDDDNEVQFGLGLRYFGDGVSGSFEWLRTEGRESFEDDTFSVNLRVDL